ncbi:prickle-like protein 4 isoform X1 [Trachemys scripta elegans]|uniref:prickle-like protein 4 isoform X1 n=1 Tax=Trachemys scripta elegans TaxID=31138 RepID=UPI001553C2C1|nr:prickle-like protein 4 isoform X1 [Trachemys scripta elegans]XP_034623230.1 prickle-like protein 4 isoform X1 [Trachemys scripta elegans]
MSLPSPTWPRRDKLPCSGTLTGLTPTSSSDSDSGCALEEYLERAADAAPAEVSSCFEVPSADRVPAATRSQLRIKSLLQQLPPQDCNDRYCPGLGEEERRQLQAFSARRRQESLGQGFACLVPSAHLCEKCGRRLNTGDLGVFASRLGDRSCWHPSCFVCHSCHQPLVDLIYFHQDGKLYCGRHHAEFFRPRCATCDQEEGLQPRSKCYQLQGSISTFGVQLRSPLCLLSPADLHRRVHRGRGQALAHGALLLPGVRPASWGAEVCHEGRQTLLLQLLREPLRGALPGLRRAHRLCQKPLLGQPVTAHRSLLYCSEACSLEKAAASSTASDSSDSAFVSAPSPDSTPVSRASSEGGRNAPPAPTMGGDSCQQRAEAEEMEDSPDQASTRPAFRSQDGHGTAFKERSKGTPCPSALAQAAAAPPGQERSSTTLPSELGLNGPGALGDQLPGRLRPQPGGGALHFRIGSSTDPSMAARQSPGPSLTDARPPDVMEEEDSWCPTCSSSSDSDSEQEGFFFGKPIPKAEPALPGRERSGLGRAAGRSKHLARLRGSRKHCSIS